MRKRHALPVFVALAGMSHVSAHAQDVQNYPSKPVRVIVAVAPGGGVDIQARIFSQRLSESLRRSFVVENRPSAAGADAYGLVAKAPPDGHTLLAVNPSFTVPHAFAKNLPDPLKEFEPIALLTRAPFLLVVHPSIPAASPGEFIVLAKARPGQLNFAGAPTGTATHLAAVWFFSLARINVTYVPYKGTGPAQAALIGGETAATMASVVSVGPHVSSGKLRALGVTSAQRSKVFPNLPTVAEQGAPGFDYGTFFGFVAPTGTPRPIINKLNSELVKAIKTPDVADKFKDDGAEAIGSTPEQFRNFIAAEVSRWRKVVQDNSIRAQ